MAQSEEEPEPAQQPKRSPAPLTPPANPTPPIIEILIASNEIWRQWRSPKSTNVLPDFMGEKESS